MRKALIIGLASLGALAAVPPAVAGGAKKKLCKVRQIGGDVGVLDNRPHGIGVKVCHQIDVLVPDDWKGASANGVNKTFSPSTNLKNK